jgi:hypothetical protein
MKFYKLPFLLFLSILFIGFSSCSKDDSDSIVGTWEFTKVDVEVTAEKDAEAIKRFTASGVTSNTTTYREDGTYSTQYHNDGGIENGTYSYKDGVLIRCYSITAVETFNVVISGNTLKEISDKDDMMMTEAEHQFPNSGITNIKLTRHYTRK